jgi:hypothetical protein
VTWSIVRFCPAWRGSVETSRFFRVSFSGLNGIASVTDLCCCLSACLFAAAGVNDALVFFSPSTRLPALTGLVSERVDCISRGGGCCSDRVEED